MIFGKKYAHSLINSPLNFHFFYLDAISILASEKSYTYFMKKIILLLTISLFILGCGSDDSGDSNSCSTPGGLNVNNLTNTTASLSWNTNVNSSLYQVEYGTLGFSLGNGTTLTIPETYADVTNLQPQTQYAFYARVFCNDSNGYSNWAGPFSFVTLENNPYCNAPTNLGVDLYPDSVNHEHIDLSWSNGEYGGSQIQYGTQGFTFGNGAIETITDSYPSYKRISGLNADTAYDFYIRNSCNESGYSTWTGPFTYSTAEAPLNANCLDPMNFSLNQIGTSGGQDYLVFVWDTLNNETSWQIRKVEAGSSFDSAGNIDISFNPVQLNGHTSVGVVYDFYIRSNCGPNGFSDWVGPITVTGP